jgi:hypothetical protein
MRPFDDKFFDEIGATKLDENQRKRCLEILTVEVEQQVGRRVCEGLSSDLIGEFERFIDGDAAYGAEWLRAHAPEYKLKRAYHEMKNKGFTGDRLITETAATLWIQTNRPDYRELVEEVYNAVRREVVFYLPMIYDARFLK